MSDTKDLGTYWVRVKFADGSGFLDRWNTGHRYTHGTEGTKPLDAQYIAPTWESEEDLLSSITYMYNEGNFSCDCNKRLFLARAMQQDEPDNPQCGDTLKIVELTVIRPNRSEVPLTLYV